jgi:hypothetical protein
MSNLLKSLNITVVYLHFLMNIGTCRNLSLFEFTCTAPAVLASVQPSVQAAVSDFMASLSTTQIGFQRTIGVEDTYVPGTVPERLYKRAAKAHESDDTNGAFVLTSDVFAPTMEELAAVQAEIDDDALTKAIETVKGMVRSSSRLRVDTKKVQLNKELDR